jgi:CheY-like chemotaxis protein
VTLLEQPVRVVTLQSAIRTARRARRRQYEVGDHLAEREHLLAAEQAARAEVEGANSEQAFLAGFEVHLAKPVSPDELAQTIVRLAVRCC